MRRAPAIIGSAIGHDVAARRDSRGDYSYRESRPYEVERCGVRYDESTEQRLDGYRVTYVYNGIARTTLEFMSRPVRNALVSEAFATSAPST